MLKYYRVSKCIGAENLPYLPQQGQLPKAGALADACKLLPFHLEDSEGAFLNHIEHIPCRSLKASSQALCDVEAVQQWPHTWQPDLPLSVEPQ